MWEEKRPEDGDIRQGDLLVGLEFPGLEFPLSVARPPGQSPKDGDAAFVKIGIKACVVISQCCEVENGRTIAVAPVRSTAPLSEEQAAVYETDEPVHGGQYAFDAFRLLPHPGALEPLDRNRLHVASLPEIQSWKCDRTTLSERLVARMNVEARRALRIKLSLYFGRAEREDEHALALLGLPPGATPPRS